MVFYFLIGSSIIVTWCAVSSVVIAWGYISNNPGVTGKKKTGKISLAYKLLHVPFQVYNSIIWAFIRRQDGLPSYHQLFGDVYIGRRCVEGRYPAACNVIIDLTSEYSEVTPGKTYKCFPMLDDAAPPPGVLEEILAFIHKCNTTVYIHCAEGRGRTGTVAAALVLTRNLAKDVDGAIELVKKARPSIRLTRVQVNALNEFLKNNSSHKGAVSV